jgi:hypothetical protein
MAEPRTSPLLVLILVLVVVAAGAGGAAVLYYEEHPHGGSAALTVQVGDNVTVNYIGVFGAGPQVGKVFDTSEFSVAQNNITWPKSLQYTSRGGNASDYAPLGVHVAANSPSYTIGNTTFGGVVTGFWQGLLGLPGNQTRYITVPANLGYPASLINASCIVSAPLAYTLPVVVTLSPAAFSKAFPSVTASAGVQFTDPTYGWPDLVLSVNSSAVVYENLPSLGMTIYPNPWPVQVTSLNATTIGLTNLLNPSQAGTLQGHVTGTGVCGVTSFIVSQVNSQQGTFLENFGSGSGGNKEVYGQTLVFIVSVVDILP